MTTATATPEILRTAEQIFRGFQFDTKSVNMNFRIKVSGLNDGVRINKLVGVSGLINLIGVELANAIINRAFNGTSDKMVCKLRRGLKVTFYNK